MKSLEGLKVHYLEDGDHIFMCGRDRDKMEWWDCSNDWDYVTCENCLNRKIINEHKKGLIKDDKEG